jgi:hypothetical protein
MLNQLTNLLLKGSYLCTGHGDPEGCEMLRLPHFQTFGSQIAARVLALRDGRLYPQEISWYSFVLEAESTPGPYEELVRTIEYLTQ